MMYGKNRMTEDIDVIFVNHRKEKGFRDVY